MVLASALVLAACSPGPTDKSALADADLASLPTPSPPATPPPDFTDLDRLVDASGSTCTLVLRGDRVVHEHPANSRHASRRVYSITKSVVGLLLMMAQDEDLLALDDPVSRYVPRWPSESAAVTIRHLMAMTSGRTWTEALDDSMIGTADQTAAALGVGQEATPGTSWRYDNLASQVLSAVLTSAVGDVETYARDRLFTPLGLTDTTWERDGAGNIKTYAGIVSSCADLVRIGVLMRDGGSFAGRQIVPASAVTELVSPSSGHNDAYGLLWWTNSEGRVVEVRRAAGFEQDREPYEGRLAPSVPADAFWALGWGNEYVAVVPSADLVAVRLGPKPADAEQLTFDTFTGTALGAIGFGS